MDYLQTGINKYLEGGREVYQDVQSLIADPEQIVRTFQNLHWRQNTALILISTGFISFVTMVLLANFTNIGGSAKIASKDELPAAKPGSPPIPPPTEIISLRIYPIKSCRGIEVTSTRLRKTGLTLDRNWMFISKDDRKFMTIRGDSSMTLIDTAIIENDKGDQDLEVSIHGTDKRVTVPAFPSKEWLKANTKLGTVEIWEQETDAWEYDDTINAPFSEYFKKPVALVYKGPTSRMVAVNGREELYGSSTPHHFADVMSLQVASEASIKDLNRRLGIKGASKPNTIPNDLTVERFRSNIIVRGRDDHPWEEDTWKRIRITTTIHGEEAMYCIDLDAVARCARCQVPNVDPDTAVKHTKEPWDEMMKFRRVDTGGPAKWKPCFGMLCIPRNEGKIEVGAMLEVLETTNNHLYNERAFADL